MTTVYYFSGTGNSLSLARLIAQKTSASLLPIAGFLNANSIPVKEDAFGIVFPVYYGNMPVIVKQFVRKLEGITGKYVFAVCTYGGSKGNAVKNLKSMLNARGGKLSLVYGIHMPQNAFYKRSEKREKLYSKAANLLKDINVLIDSRSTGYHSSDRFMDIITSPMSGLFEPMSIKGLQQITHCTATSNIDELIRTAGSTFCAGEGCSGCGTCARVCPVGNITMTGDKPVWQAHCENCLACYNLCPSKAIDGPIVKNGYFYLHPGLKLQDAIQQSKNADV